MIDFNYFNENISDEMLAAYIDGNAAESEKSLIENSISDDSMLSEAVDIANDATSLDNSFDWDLHKGDYGFWELGLPPVLNENDVMVAADICDTYLGVGEENPLFSNSLDISGDDILFDNELSNIDDAASPNNTDDLFDTDDLDNTF